MPTDYLALIARLLNPPGLAQVRAEQTPGAPAEPSAPTPWGYNQAENQANQLFDFWMAGAPLHPYLPEWLRNEYTPAGMPSVPYEPFDEWTGRRVPL